jgi:hypothetical protein
VFLLSASEFIGRAFFIKMIFKKELIGEYLQVVTGKDYLMYAENGKKGGKSEVKFILFFFSG